MYVENNRQKHTLVVQCFGQLGQPSSGVCAVLTCKEYCLFIYSTTCTSQIAFVGHSNTINNERSGHTSPQRSTNNASRLHWISTWRFIPKGNEVLRVRIQLLSNSWVLCRQGSWLYTWSLTITVIHVSACECELLLKWAVTGEPSVLLCRCLSDDRLFCN